MPSKKSKSKSKLYGDVETTRTTVILPRHLYERAKNQGLNFSIILRNALEDKLRRLEGNTKHHVREHQENTLSNGGSVSNHWARSSGGLEHRPPEPGVAGSSPAGPATREA